MEFTAIDLETTGILPYVDCIVEVAAVRFNNGKIVDRFQTLVNPNVVISKQITKINGITNEMVDSQPPIEEVLEPFSKFCNDSIIVAHNATFDFQFLCSAIKKHKSLAPSGPILDTYALAKKTMHQMVNYKLPTLIRYLKIKNDLFHRALQDAECCGYLFCHIVNQLQENQWQKLSQISGKPVLRFPQINHLNQQLNLL